MMATMVIVGDEVMEVEEDTGWKVRLKMQERENEDED